MSRFCLRQGDRRIALDEGKNVIGRGWLVAIRLDDEKCSRKHAAVIVDGGSATFEDLGSRNGSAVNGEAVRQPVTLRPGDLIHVGRTELFFEEAGAGTPVEAAARARDSQPEAGSTEHGNLFQMLGEFAHKAIEGGRLDEAELVVGRLLADFRTRLQTGFFEAGELHKAGSLAVTLARASGKPVWIDWVFELHRIPRRLLDAEIVEALREAAAALHYGASGAMRNYVETVRARKGELSPEDLALLDRVEALWRACGGE